MSTELTHYNAARKALAQARRIDEVRNIHDKARAMETYAKLAKEKELLGDAIEIRMRAEIRAGELLREMKQRGERETKGGKRGNQYKEAKSQAATLPKLSDLGVSKTQSSRWQQLAALSKTDQEQRISRVKEATGIILEKSRANRTKRNGEESETADDYQMRLLRKLRKQIVRALGSLLISERTRFLELLRIQLDDLKETKK